MYEVVFAFVFLLMLAFQKPFYPIALLISILAVFKKKFTEKELIFIIAILLIFLFAFSGMLSSRIPVICDFPWHFFKTNVALENFPFFSGYSTYFNAGYEEGIDTLYPPFEGFFVSSLHKIFLGFAPLGMLFNFYSIFSFLLPCVGVFLVSKRLGLDRKYALISVLLFVSFPHLYFAHGTTSHYSAIGFAMLSIYFYTSKESRHRALSSVFTGLTLFSHPTILMCLAIVLFIIRRDKFLLLNALAILAFSVPYISPALQSSESSSLWKILEPYQYDLNTILFRDILKDSLLVVILAGFFSLWSEGHKHDSFLFSGFWLFLLGLCVWFLQRFDIPFILSLGRGRIFFFARTLMIFPAVLFIKDAISTGKHRKAMAVFLASFFIISNMIFLLSYWTSPQTAAFSDKYGTTMYDWQNIQFQGGIFGHQPLNITQTIFDWLLQYGRKDSRVLFEGSHDRYYGGYYPSIGPLVTGIDFVGGYIQSVSNITPITTMFKNNAYDGMIFGKRIEDYSVGEFEEKLRLFNIRYVVAYSGEFNDFLLENPDKFSAIIASQDDDISRSISLYWYKNAGSDFVLTENARIISKTNSRIALDVDSSGEVILSYITNPRWRAYQDGQEIGITGHTEHGFMKMYAEQGEVILRYRRGLLQVLSFVIVFAFSGLILIGFKRGWFN